MDQTATLYVYPGLNSLPSIDPACCQLMLLINYYKLENVRIKYYKCYTTLKIPCLQKEGKNYYDLQEISKIFKEMRNNGASQSPEESEKTIYPYIQHIEHCFNLPTYLQMYDDHMNRQHTLRTLKKSFIFPFSMIFARRTLNNVETTLFFYNETKNFINWNLVVEQLQSLSNKLDNKPFLLENRSEIDCYLVGKLAPVLLGKYPTNDFKQRIDQSKYLSDYITNYIAKYAKHPNSDFEREIQKYNEENKDEESAATSTVILAALFAGTAMILFGMFNGII